MNLVKNLMMDTLVKVEKKASRPSSNKVKLTKGLCISCENNSHCLWRQNDKIYCQHFE